ncbi:hypothetical protein NDA01_12880 [Trichocoleus desertorum AS-A10]
MFIQSEYSASKMQRSRLLYSVYGPCSNHNAENDDVFVGVVRTVFQF